MADLWAGLFKTSAWEELRMIASNDAEMAKASQTYEDFLWVSEMA